MGDGADGNVDGEALFPRRAGHEGEIGLSDEALAPLAQHLTPGPRIACEQDDPGGAPAEAMSRGRPRKAPFDEPEQGVLEEASARHRGQARGLGHSQKIPVAVEEGEAERDSRLFPRRSVPNE